MRAVIYARLSDDHQGASTGIDRQLRDCRAFCEAKDWKLVREYTDSDLSAFRKGVKRPEYEDMLESAGRGEFDVILVWKLDRLVRRISEFGRAWSILDAGGVGLASVKDSFDTNTTVGLIVVHILVGVAQMESENISIRSRAKHAELRRLGKRGGGGPRPFGHTDDWKAIVPEEAKMLREAAARIMAGETPYGIVKDWQAQGIRTPNGKQWNPKTLRDMLLQDRMVGERGGVGGQIAQILTRAEWDPLRSLLLSRPRQAGVTSRKYLLSSFLYCDSCDIRMKAHRHAAGLRYRCPECYVSIMAAPVEAMLVEGVLTLIENTELPEDSDDEGAALLASINADEQSLVDLSRARYVERSLTEAEFRGTRDELVDRVAANKRRYMQHSNNALYDKQEVRTLWGNADLLWRRSVLGSVVEKVKVKRATRLGRFFDPSRLEVSWRS